MPIRIAIWAAFIVLFAAVAAPDAAAYIHYPPMTLQKMCKDSHHIRVLHVEKLDKDKGVIVFASAESLKGRMPKITSFRHVLRPGEEGTKQILARLEKGKSAVMFCIEGTSTQNPVGIGYVFIDNFCYTVDFGRSGEYWILIRAEPGMSACYHGSAEQLRGFVKDVLAGKEVKAPVQELETKEDRAKRYKEVNDVLEKSRERGKAKEK